MKLICLCVLLFVSSWLATIYYCHSMAGGMRMPGGWTMSMMWMAMPGYTWPLAALFFMSMWTSMMMAMMIPSLVPMLWQYRLKIAGASQRRTALLTVIVAVGYFFVWSVFGIISYILGIVLSSYEMQYPALSRAVPFLAGILILSAGILQFTKFKIRQLACCRETTNNERKLAANASSAWQHGLRLGLQCFRCCFGLMIILLVAGMMNLLVMFIVTVAITVERILPAGQRLAFVNGIGAVVAGSFLLVQAFGV